YREPVPHAQPPAVQPPIAPPQELPGPRGPPQTPPTQARRRIERLRAPSTPPPRDRIQPGGRRPRLVRQPSLHRFTFHLICLGLSLAEHRFTLLDKRADGRNMVVCQSSGLM